MITTGSTTYTVKEVNGDRVIMVANTDLPISPAYVALMSEIEEVKG